MKRILWGMMAAILILSATVTVNANDSLYNFSITYETGCDDQFKPTEGMSRTDTTFLGVTRQIPRREGYEFLGWREENGDKIYAPGERIKLADSISLVGEWKRKNSYLVSFREGNQDVLPTQVAIDGNLVISEMIPKKDGNIFKGWKSPSGKEILKAGDTLLVKADTVLSPLWERGTLPSLGLEVASMEDGSVKFMIGRLSYYENCVIYIENLKDGTARTIPVSEEITLVNVLDEGQYRGYVKGERYGNGYISEAVPFVVHSGESSADNPLRLFYEGEEMNFNLPPLLIDGYTYIALRHFCETMGATVVWTEENRGATITLKDTVIKVFEGKRTCIVNGTTTTLPVPTRIVTDSMFIPLRSIGEMCGCEIVWDNSRKVYVFPKFENLFDGVPVALKGDKGSYLAFSEGGAGLDEMQSFEGAWVFSEVDKANGIYEIYNLCDLERPLSVRDSEIAVGQSVNLQRSRGRDGHLWKVEKSGDLYTVRTLNAGGLFLDIENMCITETEKTIALEMVEY